MIEFDYNLFLLSNHICECIYNSLISSCYVYTPYNNDKIPDILSGEFIMDKNNIKCIYNFDFSSDKQFNCNVSINDHVLYINVDCGETITYFDKVFDRKENIKLQTLLYEIYNVLPKNKFIYIKDIDKYDISKNIKEYKELSKKYYADVEKYFDYNFSIDFIDSDILLKKINFETNKRITNIKCFFKSKMFCNDYE